MGEVSKMLSVRLACRILLNENLNIAETAARRGYAEEVHFCRLFRQEYGLTPKGYRKKFR